MSNANKSFSLPKHILQPTNRTLTPKLLKEAVAEGYDLLDVSKCLHFPRSGELIQSHGGHLRIAAQFEVDRCDSEGSAGNSIKEQCKRVLNKLSIDKIDFFYQRPSKRELKVAEVMAELKELVMEGYVGHVGIAQKNSAVIREAHSIQALSAVVVPISPWNPPNSNPTVKACRELGISIIATKVKAGGLLDLETNDTKWAKDTAASMLASQKDKLVERVSKAQTQSKIKFTSKAKNLLVDFAMKFSSSIHSFVCQKDARFLEKLCLRTKDGSSRFVDGLYEVAVAQRQKLMGMVDVVISNHLKRLTTKLEKVEAEAEMNAATKQIMESMSARLFHRLVLMRSKQMKIRMSMIKSEFGEESDLWTFAGEICSHQSVALSRRFSRVRSSLMEKLVAKLEQLRLRNKKTANVISAAAEERSVELQTALPKVLGVRKGSSIPVGLARLIQHQRNSLGTVVMDKVKASPSLSMSEACMEIVTKKDAIVVKRVEKIIESRHLQNEQLAASFAGQNFCPVDAVDGEKSNLGHTILEEGVVLNKNLQQVASDKGIPLLSIVYAWLRTQSDDISSLCCIDRPRKRQVLRVASELAGGEEIHRVQEYVGRFQSEVSSALSWTDIDKEEELPKLEAQAA